ncbi:serine--pyruvate aminotransferase-like [Gigantopelta aegis]|uniref:serine--pyruvate aminotransferase-like n=1 Tax=Gigantopelta aegis TaxID=1735272 RepID=UPI001B88E4D1|nr:serine--pyruvate aminotransferase-like [Gigantopelta aegis]
MVSIFRRLTVAQSTIYFVARGPRFSRFCTAAATMSTQIDPPESLLKPMNFPMKVLMGPGPSNCPPRVLAAGALPLLGHLHPEFIEIMDEVKAGIKYAFQTNNEWTFVISGTGHAAMEASVCNLLETGDVTLSCQNGVWGERYADMAERNGATVHKLVKPMGEVFSLKEIEEALKQHSPAVLFITHGESSGGTAQPFNGIGNLCHKYNCLLLVDSVAAMGGVPLRMDQWDIDALYSGSQKVLSVPPGTSIISFSEKAKKKIQNRKTKVRSWYFDANELANYWGCDDKPRRYHHTAPISSVYALREGLARLAEEGLQACWARHKQCAELLYEGLEKRGLKMLVKDKSVRNPCVSTILVPDGVNGKDVCDYAMKNYRVEIAGGLGDLAGKVWRIGIMGYNCTPDNVRLVLRALGEAVEQCKQ